MTTSFPVTSAEWRTYLADDGLSFPPDRQPQTEESVLAIEQQLGTRLPPSFRNFMLVTDGWTPADGSRWQFELPEAKRVFWLRIGMPDLIEAWVDLEDIVETITPCLLVLDRENGVFWLLDPTKIDDDGEWTAYEWAAGDGEDPLPFASFAALAVERGPKDHG